MAVTTTTELNALFNVIYEDALLVAREQVIMTNLVSNFSAKGWMTRTFKNRPTISAVAVAEVEDFAAPTTFGATAVGTLTPGEVMTQVVLTDREIETDPDDARTQAVTEMGNAIAAKIDTDLLADFSLLTQKGAGAGLGRDDRQVRRRHLDPAQRQGAQPDSDRAAPLRLARHLGGVGAAGLPEGPARRTGE